MAGWAPGTAAHLTEPQLLLYYEQGMEILQMRAMSSASVLFGGGGSSGGKGGMMTGGGSASSVGGTRNVSFSAILKELKEENPDRTSFGLDDIILKDLNRTGSSNGIRVIR